MRTWSATRWPTHSWGRPDWAISGTTTRIPIRNGSGLDSTRLLAEVVDRIEQPGWRAVNCDVIIHAQEPKLGPHKQAIRANLARLLRVGETAVNVKAKTGEHVGPIGRGEAIVLPGRRAHRADSEAITA